MRKLIVAGGLAAALAGCQTPTESLNSATDVCIASGFRPGTTSYSRCVNGNYQENRRVSQETGNAVAAGVVAGVVGGALVAGSARGYGYRRYGYGYGWY